MKKTYRRFLRKRHPLNISQLIALVFLGIILLGTLLLDLPFASRSGVSCGIRTALFTATSSTCVTGLILADTWTQWSGFGQAVLLCLIEIGGLGFMSMASLVITTLRKKLSLNQQLAVAQSIGTEDIGEALRVQKRTLIGCFCVEGAGALLLFFRFLPTYGIRRALRLGVFHSVSAFCNAGFDIFGFATPGESLIPYATDPFVILVISALIVLGGLGFLVWDEVLRVRQVRRWSVYTRLVLITTAILLAGGTGLICLVEWNNPGTLGGMSVPEKLLAGFFQSVTSRTAGFAGMDQAALTDAGKAVTVFLMLIGGSSGSTAGGLKTVTFIVMVLFLWSRLRGKDRISVFCRTIPETQVLNALTVFGVMVSLSFFGGAFIAFTSPVGFADGLYEAVSAIATVGLTAGATPSLGVAAQLLMIAYMYFGRVGILTISLGFLHNREAGDTGYYAETNLLIG